MYAKMTRLQRGRRAQCLHLVLLLIGVQNLSRSSARKLRSVCNGAANDADAIDKQAVCVVSSRIKSVSGLAVSVMKTPWVWVAWRRAFSTPVKLEVPLAVLEEFCSALYARAHANTFALVDERVHRPRVACVLPTSHIRTQPNHLSKRLKLTTVSH